MTVRNRLLISLLVGALTFAVYSGSAEARKTYDARSVAEAKARPLSDSEIIGVTEIANAGELKQALLAEKKARRQTARSFAGLMVTDHEDAGRKVESLAKELGASEQTALGADVKNTGEAVERKLTHSAPAAFDRLYLETQIDEHQKLLHTFDDRLIPAAKSPKLKSLLGDLRAHFAHHLQIAKETLTELAKS